MTKINRPGAPANPARHLPGDNCGTREPSPRRGHATGKDTVVTNDIADPHPSQEDGYGRKSKILMGGL